MATFGLLFVCTNSLHFHLNKQFQTLFVVSILRFQKWFDVDVLGLRGEGYPKVRLSQDRMPISSPFT
jgi:hypothetical protein